MSPEWISEQFHILIGGIPNFFIVYMRKRDKVVFLRNLWLNRAVVSAVTPDLLDARFGHLVFLTKCRTCLKQRTEMSWWHHTNFSGHEKWHFCVRMGQIGVVFLDLEITMNFSNVFWGLPSNRNLVNIHTLAARLLCCYFAAKLVIKSNYLISNQFWCGKYDFQTFRIMNMTLWYSVTSFFTRRQVQMTSSKLTSCNGYISRR